MSSAAPLSVRALKIIAPSFLSGFVSLVSAVGVIAWVLIPFFYVGSYLERYGEVLVKARGGIVDLYAFITNELNSSDLIGNITIFCVWAIVGLAVYYLVVALLSLVIDLIRFADILGYENSDKKSIVTEASERFMLRTVGIVCLGVFAAVVFQLIVPVILTLIAASFSSPPLMAAMYLIASVVFTMAVVHIIVVLLRVIFLRTRLIFRDYDSINS